MAGKANLSDLRSGKRPAMDQVPGRDGRMRGPHGQEDGFGQDRNVRGCGGYQVSTPGDRHYPLLADIKGVSSMRSHREPGMMGWRVAWFMLHGLRAVHVKRPIADRGFSGGAIS